MPSSNGTAIRQSSNKARPGIGSRSRRRRFGPRSIQPCIFLAIGVYVTLFLSLLLYFGLSGKSLPTPSEEFVKRGRSAVNNGLGVDTRRERRRKEELLMQSHHRKKAHHRYKRLLTLGPDILGDGIVHGVGSTTRAWNHKGGRTTADILHINMKKKTALHSSQPEAGDRNADDAEKEETVARDCHPMASWQTKFYPTCNDVHTLDITAAGINKDEQMADILALGGKRIAWRYHTILVESTPAGDGDGDEIVVMKTLQWSKNFTGGDYATNQRDVVAMEQLSSSSRVVSPYGHCGVTVVNEYGYLGGADVYLGEDSSMQLSTVERLRFARDAALAIADVHAVHGEITGSTNATALVHGDVRPWNFVVTYAPGRREKLKRKHRRPKSTDVVLKLHDFNAAKFVEWNATGRDICRFENNVCNMVSGRKAWASTTMNVTDSRFGCG